jgi:hypothetical protein
MNKIINVAGGAGDLLAYLLEPNVNPYPEERIWGNNHLFPYMFQTGVEVCHLNSENDEYSFLQHTGDYGARILFVGYNDYTIPMRRYAIQNHVAKLGTTEYAHQSEIIANVKSNFYNIPHCGVLYCDNLHAETELNKRLYSTLVEFFQLDEDYNSANELFKAWKECEGRITKGFLNFFNGQEFTDRLTSTTRQLKHI